MKLKKAISGILATAVLASTMFTGVQPALAWEAPDNNWQAASDVKARFFIGSDIHIGRNNATQKLTNALNAFYSVDKDPNGVLFIGDLTESGAAGQYSTLMTIINESDLGKAGKVELSMGNHEYLSSNLSDFESKTGQEPNEVIYYDNAGNASNTIGETLAATVIKLSAKNYNGDYTDQYEMVKTALEKATAKNTNAPIIVIGHHGIKNTAYVTNEWYGNYGAGTEQDMIALFKSYPQVIHFSGHSHATLEDARSIHQNDGYTAIQDGTIGAYFENEKGKVDPTSGSNATRPTNSEVASQALQLDVLEDGTVKIYRMNLTTGAYMYEGEPWTFKSGDTNDRPYDENRLSQSPSFDEEATVSAAYSTEKTVTVEFPAASPASNTNNDMIHEYKITLTPQNGGSSVTRTIFSDYYEAVPKDSWKVNIIGLKSGTTYDVSVTAVTSFGAESSAITGKVTTLEEKPYVTPKPDVLNINFNSDTGTADANGHTFTQVGEPTQKNDDTYGIVYHFDGVNDGFRYAMDSDDYTAFKDGYTMETFVKLTGDQRTYADPFGNTESAGCGFEFTDNGNTLEFFNRVGSSYKTPTADMTALKGQWVHLMATFDGETTKLYVNGVLKDSVESAGSMTVPAAGARYFYIGGDTNGSGALQNPANCDIALARLYSGAMNATDIAKTYESIVKDDNYETPTADILNIDFSSDNGTADANGHTFSQIGEPTKIEDAIFGTVYRFDGNNDGFRYAIPTEDYEAFKQSYSMEVMVNLHNLNKTGDPFSNMETAGCGFELNGDGQHITFWNHVNGYKKAGADISDYKDKWVHLMATFDGEVTRLYVNGNLESTVASKGSMTVPKATAQYFYLGGDTNGSGNLQYPANCDIAFARLYSGAMNATDISQAYEDAFPTFTPDLNYNEDGGTVTITPAAAQVGEKVTITAAPKADYTIGSVTVNKEDGATITVTDNGDGTFSFIQPAIKTSINVIFDKHYKPEIPETSGGTITLNPANPKVGDDVTVTPTAEKGYKIDHITLTVTNTPLISTNIQTQDDTLKPGDRITLIPDENGNYSFTQPAYEVTLEAFFTKENSGGSGGITHYVPDVTHNNGGTVTVTPNAAAAGDRVTITPVPEQGFKVEQVLVTDKNGQIIATRQNSDGTFYFEQPLGKVSITVTFSEKNDSWNNPYIDIHENDWFFDPVRYVQQNGLMFGTSDNQFEPNLATTRGMLVTILWRQAGEPTPVETASFEDVAADSWYADAIAWASSKGIVGGYGNGLFGANDPITREQLASMLQRFAEYNDADTSARGDLTSFNDGTAVSTWAQEPVQWAVGEGLLGGFEDNTLRPQGQATRAQVASLLQRIYDI